MTITLEAALVKIFITAIVCLCVYATINMILRWVRQMAEDGLPMFTRGELVWKDKESTQNETNPVGFSAPEEEKPVEKKSDKEIKDAIMKDPITMTAALLRGEVDIDEL